MKSYDVKTSKALRTVRNAPTRSRKPKLTEAEKRRIAAREDAARSIAAFFGLLPLNTPTR